MHFRDLSNDVVVATIPASDLVVKMAEARDEYLLEQGVDPDVYGVPVYAVVATTDGERWFIDEIESPPDYSAAVLSGEQLLVTIDDGSFLYDLAQ